MIFSLGLVGQPTLQQQIAKDAAAASGRVGVACSLPGTNLDCNWNANAKLPMQSVYKLPIALATLARVEQGKLTLHQEIRFLPFDILRSGLHSPLRDANPHANVDVTLEELLRLTVSESDGVASDILMRTDGGASVIDAYIRALGIEGIRIVDPEKNIAANVNVQYRNYAQPSALVQLLRRIADHSPLSPEHTALLLKWMIETPTGEHRLKELLPPGTIVAHKTGTSGTDGGITHATNDTGLITLADGRRMAIAVLISDSPHSEQVREHVIAQIAYDIWCAAASAQQTSSSSKLNRERK